MATIPSASRNSHQTEDDLAPLISGLPDDISLLCLARVPRRYHNTLRCVSKRWKSLLGCEAFRRCRREHNFRESWVYAVCKHATGRTLYYVLNPFSSRRSWTALQGVPPQCVRRDGMSFETVGSKLFILGGCSWQEDATDDVYFYDASTNSWGIAASMPTPRCYCLSAVLENKIYVTNEATMSSSASQTWDIYDSHYDIWTKNQEQLPTDIQKLVPLDGKIYTVHESSPNVFHQGVLGPPLDDGGEGVVGPDLASCCHNPTVLVNGDLYMLDQSRGAKLMTWHRETRDWAMVGRLSPLVIKPRCQLAAYDSTIVFVGKGLATTAFDVERAGRVTGTMVGSYTLPEVDPSLVVLSCNTITL